MNAGIIMGAIFKSVRIPLPAAPVFTGIVGIVGVWLGGTAASALMEKIIGCGGNSMKIGLIGGTGLYNLFHMLTEQCFETEYGQVTLLKGEDGDKEVYFCRGMGRSMECWRPM